MPQINILWKKELKNCVAFRVFANGTELGLIRRGEEFPINLNSNTAELYFVPKAPRWFGWKALKVQVQITGNSAELHLGVQVPNHSIMGGFMPQELRNAANINNQLHCIDADGVMVTAWDFVKKY